MRNPAQHLGRAVFGTAVLAALGFGGTQAFAATTDAPAETARTCNPSHCDYRCRGSGYWGGLCLSTGECLCY